MSDHKDDIAIQNTREHREARIEAILKQYGPEDARLIRRAYEYAEAQHEGQKRRSGEAYIIHPLSVAEILCDLGLDTDSIIAGLLHDCIEDTATTVEDVKDMFGPAVALLVDGVTRLDKLKFENKEDEQMEDLRKMFVAMAKDIRVILIKLADRLHNARTFQYLPPVKQQEKSLETMEIYAPLAHRLGMEEIKWELEEICLQYLDPVGYKEITDYLASRSEDLDGMLEQTKAEIRAKLEQEGIQCRIKSRLKHVYSIYRKLYGQNLSFEELYDLCGIRVIVQDLADCYNVLGLIHDLYKPVPGRFKDYISTPKPNGYQSLHTAVIGRVGMPFEVQIRTEAMNNTAEYGVAAHWKYKDGLRGQQSEETFAWVRQLLEGQQDIEAADFIKSMKVDLFADEVFVFTPKGDVINLPAGANPIDFAYMIHSAVGNRMTGAKVNGRIVPIDYELKSGEIVEVITSKTSNGPKRDWLQIVKTNGARTKIKQWFKKERREENIEQGRTELERELRAALLMDDFNDPELQKTLLERLNIPSLEELYASLGFGAITVSRVIGKVKEEITRRNRLREAQNQTVESLVSEKKKKTTSSSGVIVEGIDNCLVKFAKCCMPIPGDSIVGFITRGFGVSVHRGDCPNARSAMKGPEAGRWIRTDWDYSERRNFNTGLRVTANRNVMLLDIATVFSNMKINITEMTAREMPDGHSLFFITAAVQGLGQLELLMNRLGKCGGVLMVERIMDKG